MLAVWGCPISTSRLWGWQATSVSTFEDAIDEERRRRAVERERMAEERRAKRQETTDFANAMSNRGIAPNKYRIFPDHDGSVLLLPHLTSSQSVILHGWTVSRSTDDGVGYAVGVGGESIQFCDEGDRSGYCGLIRPDGCIQFELRMRRSSLPEVAVRLIEGDGPIYYTARD